MTIAQYYENKGMQQGMQQGEQRSKEHIAAQLLTMPDLSIDKIAKATGLSRDEIEKISKATSV